MRTYLDVLRRRDYTLLWGGSIISLLGDGATWTVLAWMALTMGGPGALAVLGVCYTLPVVAGGALIGPLLDRVSRRLLLILDSLLRAAVVGCVPLLAVGAVLELWHLYVVAAVYGLLKIVPMGVVPAVMPDIVPKEQLQAAVALEAIAYGAAGMLGPALGGLLLAQWNASIVLVIDASTYLIFAACVMLMRSKLPRPDVEVDVSWRQSFGWGPVFSVLRRDAVLLSITIAFALFNATVGMLRVATPWIVAEQLASDAATLGLVLGVSNGAGLVGSLAAGAFKPAERQLRRIGVLQIIAGGGLVLLFHPSLSAVLLGLVVSSLFSAPMTVFAQVIRIARIPVEIRGRMMTFLRTLMNSISPGGSAIAGPLLAAGLFHPLVALMAITAALPGLYIVLRFGSASFAKELGLEASPAATSASAGD